MPLNARIQVDIPKHCVKVTKGEHIYIQYTQRAHRNDKGKDRITMGILEDIKHTGRLEQAGVVRPKGNGRYELIAGHRRRLACTLAGRPTLPVVIREMSDDEAIIAMQRSNTQREDVLPSEKAFAYKMRMEAEARQGQRTDLTSSPLETKLASLKRYP